MTGVHVKLLVREEAAPSLTVAAQMTLYLHYPQREAAERCKCQAGAKPHVSQKSMSAGTCALLKKPLDFVVFQTMLWPDCYLQPESAW